MTRRALLLVLSLATGCAARAPVPAVTTPPPSAPVAAPRPAPVSPRPVGSVVKAVLDSMPSPEAIEILGSIPEPLSTAETIAPPARDRAAPIRAPEAAFDTLRAGTESVPVPGSTMQLGAPVATPSATPPESSVPVAAEPDTCWRLQVAAPAERDKAATMHRAAQSLLLVPMVIVPDAGRYKVRSAACLERPAAEALRARAIASGFSGVFLVRESRSSR